MLKKIYYELRSIRAALGVISNILSHQSYIISDYDLNENVKLWNEYEERKNA